MAVEQRSFVDDGCYSFEVAWEVGKGRVDDANCGLLDLLGGSLKEPKESIKVKMPVLV